MSHKNYDRGVIKDNKILIHYALFFAVNDFTLAISHGDATVTSANYFRHCQCRFSLCPDESSLYC